MEQIFTGFPCAIIVDDIIVGGKGEKEHDENLRKVLNRARQVNLKLNPQKCKFRLKENIVNKLKRHFSVHGIPQKLVTDNGTQFTSQIFRDFASSWDFCHITSSPEYSQGNTYQQAHQQADAEAKIKGHCGSQSTTF
ncbi:12-(S)-hydroxy-5,8,10,14-eicosatetraenoic acid receptor-like protein [Labeo rohita]|uniref:ribonuclease H n=1 Tax=Labeo rohita TaxID=84645 RepID=A0A498LKP7_LABRO|nr:12-(S)-hydroxy-5,8,10,14-eicosatetraenoic acid receptor-like protein [Labeo rohita]